MPDTPSSWISYVGAITGSIGALTGITGAVFGILGYRHSRRITALNLRIDLKRHLADLRRTVQSLPAHLEHAKRSRSAVNSARGLYKSGAMAKWLADWESDLAVAKRMNDQLPTADEYSTIGTSDLEAKLVAMHTVIGDALKLQKKYDAGIAEDDQHRLELRAHAASRLQPK